MNFGLLPLIFLVRMLTRNSYYGRLIAGAAAFGCITWFIRSVFLVTEKEYLAMGAFQNWLAFIAGFVFYLAAHFLLVYRKLSKTP